MFQVSRILPNDWEAILKHSLESIQDEFDKDELAYLSLTSKVEAVIRDRLAWKMQKTLDGIGESKIYVSREYRRHDFAVLERNPAHNANHDEMGKLVPLLVGELKTYGGFNFDCWSKNSTRLFDSCMADIRKLKAVSVAHLGDHELSTVFLLILVQPMGKPAPWAHSLVKYFRSFPEPSHAELVRRKSVEILQDRFSEECDVHPVHISNDALGVFSDMIVHHDYLLLINPHKPSGGEV